MLFCCQQIESRDKFSDAIKHKCWKEINHLGKCEEYPHLSHFRKHVPKLADKIKRDSIYTTGAAWKSDKAGPNRILRWALFLEEVKSEFAEHDKLFSKAASYETCMNVSRRLTHLAYGSINAPKCPFFIEQKLAVEFGPIATNKCIVCKKPIYFEDFSRSQIGKSTIETAHIIPRLHTAKNIGFAHRECNIAQGDKSLDEFYGWIEEIMSNRLKEMV